MNMAVTRLSSDAAISASELVTKYDNNTVLNGVNFTAPKGKITTLLGPNGSGKSTLLKSCTRLTPYQAGLVKLLDQDIASIGAKALAKQLAVLPQSAQAPAHLDVETLVAQGRYANLGPFGMLKQADRDAIELALQQVGLVHLRKRDVSTLSGGERQRAWIALCLAQQAQILALDEPTTYLDIGHQLEILELVQRLNQEKQLTVIMVLHDLNHAAQFSDHLVVLEKGKIIAQGDVWQVLTPDLLANTFATKADVMPHPITGKPLILPYASLTNEQGETQKQAANYT